MMNHFAQESRSGSVLAEWCALCVGTEMGGYRGDYVRTIVCECQGLALYPHKHLRVGLLHHTTGGLHRLRGGSIHRRYSRFVRRRKQLNADAHQEQQYVPKPFHFSKASAKVHKKSNKCKSLWDFFIFYASFSQFFHFKFLLSDSARRAETIPVYSCSDRYTSPGFMRKVPP